MSRLIPTIVCLGVALLMLPVLSRSQQNAGPCCLVSDNGSGTAEHPPHCPPDGYLGSLRLVEGLPDVSTVEMEARLGNFVVVASPGGVLGGDQEIWTAELELDIQGTGSLAGFQRSLTMAVNGETHTAPRAVNDPVQSFAFRVIRFQGLLTGDQDFSLLQFEGGDIFGLDSQGHTVFMRQGGIGADFSAESAFDFNYRIQLEGSPESQYLSGWRGITLDEQASYQTCENAVSGVPGGSLPGIRGAHPNPFRRSATVEFETFEPGWVDVEVLDIRGRPVRILTSGFLGRGPHSAAWNGQDDRGVSAAAGIYFARIRTAKGVGSLRLVRIP